MQQAQTGGLYRGILLVSDMDRTLIGSDHQISPRNCAAIEQFVREGGYFTIATGRDAASVRPFLQRVAINCPCILENGGLLYDFAQDRPIWESPMSPEVVGILQALAREYPDAGIEAFTRDEILILKENSWTRWHMARDSQPHNVQPAIAMTKPWYKLTVANDPETMQQLIDWLTPRLGGMRTACSEPYFFDIVNPGVSKGPCLQRLAAHLGVAENRTVAVGDYDNDVEMIEAAAYGFAVGNATECVKRVARYRCSDCDHDAMADLIARLPQIMGLNP